MNGGDLKKIFYKHYRSEVRRGNMMIFFLQKEIMLINEALTKQSHE